VASLHELFATRIMTAKILGDAAWHEELAEIAEEYAAGHMARYDSGFKHAIPHNLLRHHSSPALSTYFAILQDALWAYLKAAANLDPQRVTPPRINLWGNVEARGEWSIPHAHQGNQVVITFYPKVTRASEEPHPYAGAIVFHNPRTMPSGFWAREEHLFTPFLTETGLLIAFPGHAAHSTFPFFEPASKKWALIANIRFSGTIEGENAADEYATIEQIAAMREGAPS
jgi:hypothetical protein